MNREEFYSLCKTESYTINLEYGFKIGCKATHKVLGISDVSYEERSYCKNKEKALESLYELYLDSQKPKQTNDCIALNIVNKHYENILSCENIDNVCSSQIKANLQSMISEALGKKEVTLPKITDCLWEQYNETSLMTWDKDNNKPHWTQEAVDFACTLNSGEK